MADIGNQAAKVAVNSKIPVVWQQWGEKLHDMRRMRHGDGAVGVENQPEEIGAGSLGADDEDGVQWGLLGFLGKCRLDFMTAAGILSRTLPSHAESLFSLISRNALDAYRSVRYKKQ